MSLRIKYTPKISWIKNSLFWFWSEVISVWMLCYTNCMGWYMYSWHPAKYANGTQQSMQILLSRTQADLVCRRRKGISPNQLDDIYFSFWMKVERCKRLICIRGHPLSTSAEFSGFLNPPLVRKFTQLPLRSSSTMSAFGLTHLPLCANVLNGRPLTSKGNKLCISLANRLPGCFSWKFSLRNF